MITTNSAALRVVSLSGPVLILHNVSNTLDVSQDVRPQALLAEDVQDLGDLVAA